MVGSTVGLAVGSLLGCVEGYNVGSKCWIIVKCWIIGLRIVVGSSDEWLVGLDIWLDMVESTWGTPCYYQSQTSMYSNGHCLHTWIVPPSVLEYQKYGSSCCELAVSFLIGYVYGFIN